MTISLTISGDHAGEVLDNLRTVAGALLGASASPPVEAPSAPVAVPVTATEAAAHLETPKPRGRKPKAGPTAPAGPSPFPVPDAEPAKAEAPVPEKVEAPAAAEPSEEDARAALVALSKVKGMATAQELVKEFGIAKVSELAAGKRAAFLARAKALAEAA